MLCLKKYPFYSGGRELSLEITQAEMVDEQEETSYTTYGVRVCGEDEEVLYKCADISTDPGFVEGFVRLCAGNDVSILHIHDLLEDYIYTDSRGSVHSGRWYW